MGCGRHPRALGSDISLEQWSTWWNDHFKECHTDDHLFGNAIRTSDFLKQLRRHEVPLHDGVLYQLLEIRCYNWKDPNKLSGLVVGVYHHASAVGGRLLHRVIQIEKKVQVHRVLLLGYI